MRDERDRDRSGSRLGDREQPEPAGSDGLGAVSDERPAGRPLAGQSSTKLVANRQGKNKARTINSFLALLKVAVLCCVFTLSETTECSCCYCCAGAAASAVEKSEASYVVNQTRSFRKKASRLGPTSF